MENALVLIVEDEPEIQNILVAYFEREGFRAITARDGEMALTHHQMLSPDLVILDIKLPRKDGLAVLSTIRTRSETPVIMVTALGEDLEKLTALKVGADDYVIKPFNPLEVVARAKAVLRRTHAGGDKHHLTRVGGLEIDTTAHSASAVINGHAPALLDLTLTEFRILSHMARSPRKAFTRGEILDACLPADGDALERTVDSHVSKLRRKLEGAGLDGYCAGVRGVGYRLLAS